MNANTITIKAVPVHQPIGDFYVSVMPAQVVKRLSSRYEREEVDASGTSFHGIQRPLSSKRLKDINAYINTFDATFPTSIILAIRSEHIISIQESDYPFDGTTLQRDCVKLVIENKPGVARVIDGQHRLMSFDENSPGFDLLTTIFVDIDDEDQAMVFTTINLNQTKVTTSLVFDLFELATTKSPQKLSHDIVKSLNSDESSAFFHRIKMLGRNPKSYKGKITQGAFVYYLLPTISDNPTRDRNLLAQKKPIPRSDDEADKGLIFREWFANGNDKKIYNCLYDYFNALRDIFPEEWKGKVEKKGRILPNALEKTVGFGALMKLLTEFFRSTNGKVNHSTSKDLFQRIKKKDVDFTKFEASGKGEGILYSKLKAAANL